MIFKNITEINYRLIARVTGFLFLIIGIFMLLPMGISLSYHEPEWKYLALSSLICITFGFLFRNIIGNKAQYNLHQREGFIIVGLTWILVPLLGSLPYILSGAIPHFTDAYFESMSGFTTTGSTIVNDISAFSKGLLVWRSLSQWIGGLGLILFSIVLLKKLKEGANFLFAAEFAGSVTEKLHPRRAKSTLLLWIVYLILTLSMFFLLLLSGNNPIHALCLAFSTVSSGGFSPVNESLSFFSNSTQTIVMVYMFFSGINLALIYYFFTWKPRKIINNEEFKWYIRLFAIFSFVVLLILFLEYQFTFSLALKNAVFIVLSTLSTSGYYLNEMPGQSFSILLIIFILMFIGGCSGSMTGSIKISRIIVLFKFIKAQFIQIVHPQAIIPVKLNKKIIRPEGINSIFTFCFLYFSLFICGTMILCLSGVQITNSVSISASIIGNIGPAIGNLCPDCSYSELSGMAKWSLSFLMLAGRLEIFALISLFSTQFWKK